jgi:formylglycine-generating enzyme required for sulfatase activity
VIISGENLTALDVSSGTMAIEFNISWNYSWRLSTGPSNWDAMWVFVKYRRNAGEWAHASLMNTGHTVPTGATMDMGLRTIGSPFNIATNPVVGVFIYKNAAGYGPNNFTGTRLIWNYAQDGVLTGDRVEFQVQAIHMVHIPSAAFYAGDNNNSTSSFRQGSSDNDPWYIGGEGAITTANIAGSGTGVAPTAAQYYDATGYTIPAAFPKGHAAFYMMRHELNQEQWVKFFNTLPTTGSSRSNHDITSSSGKNTDALSSDRNNVRWTTGDALLNINAGNRTFCTVPVNWLNWGDLAAYLDWSGLRPMTELEYEKAARGTLNAVSGEYAWGTNTGTNATGITNGGSVNEVPSPNGSHVTWTSGVPGPLRIGSFASLNYGGASRVLSGGSYYGVLELSGNVREQTITVGNTQGRAFDGVHGDGALDSNGLANTANWPANSTGTGAGFRGGSWSEATARARVSDRNNATTAAATRAATHGGRGVRIAP